MISTLATHDASSTHLYTLLLLILPLAPIPLYIPHLGEISGVIPSLVGIASLLASAYVLWYMPLPPKDVGVLEGQAGKGYGERRRRSSGGSTYGLNGTSWQTQRTQTSRRSVPYISSEVEEWLAAYLVTVNCVVGGLLAVRELWQGREWHEGVVVGGGYLPLLICVVVLWARRELRMIDVGALERLDGDGRASGRGK